jgi:hypothetical protein
MPMKDINRQQLRQILAAAQAIEPTVQALVVIRDTGAAVFVGDREPAETASSTNPPPTGGVQTMFWPRGGRW